MNNRINQKPNRAERPDQTIFRIMTGAFFLIFSVAPAYWAFYNFDNYRSAAAFVQELKTKSGQSLTPDERRENENRIFFSSSQADRYKLEMILSGAGAFVLFAISFLFFKKAYGSRGRKNFYEDIDWRKTAMPTARLEVRFTNYQNILLAGLIVFFALITACNFYQNLTDGFSSAREIIVKSAFSIIVFAIIFAVVFLVMRAKRRAVKLFDSTGVTRGDGRHFSWAEFQGVVTRTARNRYGKNYVWREELVFSGGEEAWIISNRIRNFNEVYDYVSKLPRAVFRETK